MNDEEERRLENEIEELNKVQNEGEDLATSEGFEKFMRKQLHKIARKDERNASKTFAQETSSGTSQRTDIILGDDVYNFNNSQRGLAVIINNEDFSCTRTSPRIGQWFQDRERTRCDKVALYKTFKNIGFDVWVLKDLKAMQILIVLKLAAENYNHADADCFVCTIMSHGVENDIKGSTETRHDIIVGTDGEYVFIKDVVNRFSDTFCSGLKEKPRLFFVQACRGEKEDHGVKMIVTKFEGQDISCKRSQRVDHDSKGGPSRHEKKVCAYPLSLYKDSLIMYATSPGYYAYRDSINGSWLIQTLCSYLDSPDIGQKSLLNILVAVTGKVALEYEKPDEEDHSKKLNKETPVIESMLVRDVFFTRNVYI